MGLGGAKSLVGLVGFKVIILGEATSCKGGGGQLCVCVCVGGGGGGRVGGRI